MLIFKYIKKLRDMKYTAKQIDKMAIEELEGDLQDWLSELPANEVQEVLDTLRNFVDNYEGEIDMEA
jgi:hypothetical protein